MINMTEKDKKKCCGCTACANICPHKAITMKKDYEGFLYPVVDKQKCTNCNLCEKICPIINKKSEKHQIDSYAIRVKNSEVLKTSTSGGFFTPIANYVLNKEGAVIGVGYGKDWRIEDILVTNENRNDLEQLRGSKYVQSYLGDMFQKIQKLLKANKTVLFSGTPCQVHGLKSYLRKEYSNLITVDLVCHGVPSPELWRKYIQYQEKKNKSKVKSINFRNKTYGYHSGTIKIVFENCKEYYGSARVDYMLKSFFSEICSRPSCYDCQFKDIYHISDFTIFDCWSASKLVKNLEDDDKGYTNVLVNTAKGKKILDDLKSQYEIYPTDMKEAIKLDGSMVEKSAIPHNKRKEFMYDLSHETIEKVIQKYIPVEKSDLIIEKSKKFFYKTGGLNWIKKLKKLKEE